MGVHQVLFHPASTEDQKSWDWLAGLCSHSVPHPALNLEIEGHEEVKMLSLEQGPAQGPKQDPATSILAPAPGNRGMVFHRHEKLG